MLSNNAMSDTYLIVNTFLTHKFRFIGIKLCIPTEKHNITILHGEEEQAILRCFEATFCIVVTKSDHF